MINHPVLLSTPPAKICTDLPALNIVADFVASFGSEAVDIVVSPLDRRPFRMSDLVASVVQLLATTVQWVASADRLDSNSAAT